MTFNIADLVGGAPAVPQSTASPSQAIAQHATGVSNTSGKASSNAAADSSAKSTLHFSALIVIGSVVALWLLGGLVFKTANL